MNTPVTQVIDHLINLEMERHAWLLRAGEQIRQWEAEEASRGDEASNKGREGEYQKTLPSNQ